jgi:hypothetical protein
MANARYWARIVVIHDRLSLTLAPILKRYVSISAPTPAYKLGDFQLNRQGAANISLYNAPIYWCCYSSCPNVMVLQI